MDHFVTGILVTFVIAEFELGQLTTSQLKMAYAIT